MWYLCVYIKYNQGITTKQKTCLVNMLGEEPGK